MNNKVIIGIVVLVIVGGGILFIKSQYGTMQQGSPSQMQPTTQPSTSDTRQPTVLPSGKQSGKTVSFTVTGNDSSGNPTDIKVNKGDTVNIKFQADANGTYHGGLDFRSTVINTGTISPGSSKMITFTATDSFAFTPYWPSTNIAKPYTINVTVE